MSIQWYPGHMTKAKKEAEETLANIDLVVEILDARIPLASQNPMLKGMRLFRQRPCLKVLNKMDLADPQITSAWIRYFKQQDNAFVIAISCKNPKDPHKILPLCRQIAPHRGSPLKPLRIMIMGIPNVGKSTLINALLHRRTAKVGDEPAITKHQRRFELDNHTILIDSPGLMWEKIENEMNGYLLAICNAIGRNAVDTEDIASFLADQLLKTYPNLLKQRFKIADSQTEAALLETIGKSRGYWGKNHQIDRIKTAIAFLTEFRKGQIGRISLQKP